MTITQDKLGELLGTFVTDLGATIGAGNVLSGTGWACTAASPTPRRPRSSSPSAPAPTPGM